MSDQGKMADRPQGTAQSVLDNARNQLLAQIVQALGVLAGVAPFPSSSVFAYKSAPITTTPYAVTANDAFMQFDATAGAEIANLPLAATVPGKLYGFIKTDASGNAVTITAAGSDKINGAATKVLAAQYNAVILQSQGGTSWLIYSLS